MVFNNNTTVWHIARQYGRLGELPQDFLPLLEKAAEAYLAMAAPGLTQPRTNDCYTLRTKSVLQPASQLFPHRQDFRWAATGRAEGTPPAGGTASRYLPWGGFAVMRSDWGPEAAYLCFDVGPLGRAHEHQDKLNINLYKGSEELIFDDGGGQYDRSPHYFHARSGAGHNTLLVDGLAQFRREPKTAEAPVEAGWISNERFDYAAADYRDGFGPEEAKFAVHRREVLFAKPDFFCVADTVNSRDGRAHDYELLFQLDTLKLKPVDELPGAVISDFGRNYDILIVPLYPEGLEVSRVSGQKEPRLAGWYAGRQRSEPPPGDDAVDDREAAEGVPVRHAAVPAEIRRGEAADHPAGGWPLPGVFQRTERHLRSRPTAERRFRAVAGCLRQNGVIPCPDLKRNCGRSER